MPVCRLLVPQAEERLDRFVVKACPELSRAQVKKRCDAGQILLNGQVVKAGAPLRAGDRLEILAVPPLTEALLPEAMPLEIPYEDAELLLVYKPRGLVVHPAPGHPRGTLVNGLLHHCGDALSDGYEDGRPGLVHRLDKDTEGLLLVAKNNQMHQALAELFRRRAIKRMYKALVYGRLRSKAGLIDAPLDRDPKDRQRRAVVAGGKPSRTRFLRLAQFSQASELALELETGRTHQIRVHLQYIKHPVIADPLYAKGREAYGLQGQALFANGLAFQDPRDGSERCFTAPDPPWYQALRESLGGM